MQAWAWKREIQLAFVVEVAELDTEMWNVEYKKELKFISYDNQLRLSLYCSTEDINKLYRVHWCRQTQPQQLNETVIQCFEYDDENSEIFMSYFNLYTVNPFTICIIKKQMHTSLTVYYSIKVFTYQLIHKTDALKEY